MEAERQPQIRLAFGNIYGTKRYGSRNSSQIEEFITDEQVSPFRRWFDDLDEQAAALVTIAIDRLGEGNTSNAKALGEGVSELRIDRGPGYRVYFGWDGKVLVILLGGGTKRRQQSDIQTALRHCCSYKARKAAGRTKRK
jgi:putative addiction module killer protein